MTTKGHQRNGSSSVASGETRGPWLSILVRCAVVAGGGVLLLAVAGLLVGGPATAASVVLGGVLVAVFFGISLLIGHVVGRKSPSAALGAFMGAYIVKIVGLGLVVFGLGSPEWLDGPWFLAAGVSTVVLWQATEVHAFSKTRFQLFADPDESSDNARGGQRGR